MSPGERSVVELVTWASFGLRMVALLAVVVLALALVRKVQPMAGWALAGAAALEAFDTVLWRVFTLSMQLLSGSFPYVLVPLRLLSLALGFAVGALVLLALWKLARSAPRSVR